MSKGVECRVRPTDIREPRTPTRSWRRSWAPSSGSTSREQRRRQFTATAEDESHSRVARRSPAHRDATWQLNRRVAVRDDPNCGRRHLIQRLPPGAASQGTPTAATARAAMENLAAAGDRMGTPGIRVTRSRWGTSTQRLEATARPGNGATLTDGGLGSRRGGAGHGVRASADAGYVSERASRRRASTG